MPMRSSSAWRPRPSARLKPCRPHSRCASGLLAALADRDQLGLDLPAALVRQADRVGLRASGHDLRISRWLHASRRRTVGHSRATLRRRVLELIADQQAAGSDGEN